MLLFPFQTEWWWKTKNFSVYILMPSCARAALQFSKILLTDRNIYFLNKIEKVVKKISIKKPLENIFFKLN